MASALQIDETTGDLAVTDNRLVVITGTDAVAQRIATRLRTVREEWFLDRSAGVPYWQTILVKNPDMVAVMGEFRRSVEQTPGVVQVLDLSFDLDAQRVLNVSFRATLASGDEITVSSFPLAI